MTSNQSPHFVCRCGSSSAALSDVPTSCLPRPWPTSVDHPQSELGLLLLVNRTNGRAYDTVLRPSVVCLYGMYCG